MLNQSQFYNTSGINRKKIIKALDIKKLEKLSMLSIDSQIENDLNEVIKIAERMCIANIPDQTKSLVHFDYLGLNSFHCKF
jgi:hypothetical protein